MPHEGVVTDRYKLVRFFAPGRDSYYELYDLQTDPRELTSVYGKTDYKDVQKKLHDELALLKRELKVPEVIPPAWFGNKGGANKTGKKRNGKAKNAE
jgi:hypothetical protein